ncbi:MAG: hypothetical protein JEY91_18755 [Spirochaetaceae bacterium]|nr:hypothetical protein [Spirochaetaceae bacterium]
MNRLFRKLKDFGLIFSIAPKNPDEIITISQSLKKAHIPVALFNWSANQKYDSVKISNQNEDLFIGAKCICNTGEIRGALASGAHFIITDPEDEKVLESCCSNGYDLIVSVKTTEDIDLLQQCGVEAVLIDCTAVNGEELMNYALENTKLTLFLKGEIQRLPIEKWRNHSRLAAFIVENTFESVVEDNIIYEASDIIHRLLGLQFRSLDICSKSSREEEARTLTALSSIPLYRDREREILTIEAQDMDRTIAFLKWKEIYMDPLTAKMDGQMIIETELYTDFLGWTVKLIKAK